ncbi:MAG: polyisoprenoid-binding protein [Geobacteraceae bacterium]|nr:polyisoprenoid-binding protein [Geobacteraceae bacterium]NTW78581.1 polyisoprenoid-binding protein [Geobacteraceae bacterium]
MKRLLALILSVALLAPLNVLAATYALDPAHTTIGFKVKHLMIANVKGVFEKFKGTVVIDEKDITKSKVNVSIEIASINTNIAKRDDHLRSGDFFDAGKYPVMTFDSTKVERAGADTLKVTGNLTIKGVTKQVVLTVDGPSGEIKSPQGVAKRGASAVATINRQDFGVSWNKKLDAGGVVVADDVHIIIDAELDRQ